jgi:2-oxoglutarate-Fe(II)-dependent oxygenase superfamily protein
MTHTIDPRHRLGMFELGDHFRQNQPFPHIVLDGFLDSGFARQLLDQFPAFDPRKAMNELGSVGRKAVNENLCELGPVYRELDELVQSADFLQWLSGVTQIPDLLYDPDYVGGGTHENLGGQDLDPHVDFNYHPARKWHRRLNLLVYLNPHWEERWGGGIELHSDPWNPAGNRAITILPVFNRCVIFETSERSWHGFKRICPPADQPGLSRKSIAFYFYTKERPESEVFPEHATFYVQRQLPDKMRSGYTLTQEDVQELNILLTKRDGWIRFLYKRELEFSSQMGELHRQIAMRKVSLIRRALESLVRRRRWRRRRASTARRA